MKLFLSVFLLFLTPQLLASLEVDLSKPAKLPHFGLSVTKGSDKSIHASGDEVAQDSTKTFSFYSFNYEVPYSELINLGFTYDISGDYRGKDEDSEGPLFLGLSFYGKPMWQIPGTKAWLYAKGAAGVEFALFGSSHVSKTPVTLFGGLTGSGALGADVYFGDWFGVFVDAGYRADRYSISKEAGSPLIKKTSAYYVMSQQITFGFITNL